MKSDDFTTEQVVSRSNIRGNSNVNTALVSKQSVNTPFSIGGCIAILINLERTLPDPSSDLAKYTITGPL
jgi:hypothetical protein